MNKFWKIVFVLIVIIIGGVMVFEVVSTPDEEGVEVMTESEEAQKTNDSSLNIVNIGGRFYRDDKTVYFYSDFGPVPYPNIDMKSFEFVSVCGSKEANGIGAVGKDVYSVYIATERDVVAIPGVDPSTFETVGYKDEESAGYFQFKDKDSDILECSDMLKQAGVSL